MSALLASLLRCESFASSIAQLLDRLRVDELSSGAYKGCVLTVLKHLFDSTIFMKELRTTVASIDAALVRWFLELLLTSGDTALFSRVSKHKHVTAIVESLGQQSAAGALRTVLGASDPAVGHSSSTVLSQPQHGPGGRHDNDFVNYRSVQIVPTIAELRCADPPYLPTAGQCASHGVNFLFFSHLL